MALFIDLVTEIEVIRGRVVEGEKHLKCDIEEVMGWVSGIGVDG